MLEYTHSDLVDLARRWLVKRRRCPVVFTELGTQSGEIPDAIGWDGWHSIVVECKVSRADFFHNAKKSQCLGVGQSRFFLVPQGMVGVSEVPPEWGLIEWDGEHFHTRLDHPGRVAYAWEHEISLLLSALRRVGPYPKGVSVRLYTNETKNQSTITLEEMKGGEGAKTGKQEIAERVKDFLMNHYLVKSGDHYRLTEADLRKLDRILEGEATEEGSAHG